MSRGDAEDHPTLVGGDGGHVGARDGEHPYDAVLAGVFVDDPPAHRAPENGVTAPQRDQVVLVKGAYDAGREPPEDVLLGYGREKNRFFRVLDGLARERNLDAAVSSAGDGE